MANNTRYAQLQSSYSLAGAGAVIGATSITLKSMTDIDGNSLTMSGTFGSKGFATLEPGNGTQEEQISFTGLANNSNGTVTLSGIKSVSFTYPYTETSGLAKTHAGSTPLVVSNTSGFYDRFTAKDNDETITGSWTVPSPVIGGNPTTKTYVDSLAFGGDGNVDSVIEPGTAGETVAAGNLLYLDVTDNEWKKTDADTASTVDYVKLGIAQGAGVNGGNIEGGVLTWGLDSNQSGMTQGDLMYASNTAGGISSSPGTTERAIGQARDATTLYFDPYFYYSPTANIKAAVAGGGNFGAPSSSNKFITEAYNSSATGLPVVRVYGATNLGSTTTQFDITNPSGTTFRYTYDGNGTNPGITSTTVPTGAIVIIQSSSITPANTGKFTVTGSGTDFFEVTNVSGFAENNKNMADGYLFESHASTWTKPSGLKYVIAEVIGGGGGGGGSTTDGQTGGGGGAGGYSRKVIAVASLGATETATPGAGGTFGVATGGTGGTGGTSSFGVHLTATGGSGGTDAVNGVGGAGGAGASGGLNISGASGGYGYGLTTSGIGGIGASSYFGGGGAQPAGTNAASRGLSGLVYGAGGSGAACSDGGDAWGGSGFGGAVIITEYYA